MKKQLSILVTLLFLGIISYGQQRTLYYYYDSNGNRTLRQEIRMFSKSAENLDDADSEQEKVAPQPEVIVKGNIKIYPNPTQGNIMIDIANQAYPNSVNINIVNIAGQSIYKYSEVQSQYNIDISHVANGTYILIMLIDSKRYEWKIIKKNN